MRHMVRRTSPAMVVACLALLVALGGTSVAAVSQLVPRNSVGTAQLRDNAVSRMVGGIERPSGRRVSCQPAPPVLQDLQVAPGLPKSAEQHALVPGPLPREHVSDRGRDWLDGELRA